MQPESRQLAPQDPLSSCPASRPTVNDASDLLTTLPPPFENSLLSVLRPFLFPRVISKNSIRLRERKYLIQAGNAFARLAGTHLCPPGAGAQGPVLGSSQLLHGVRGPSDHPGHLVTGITLKKAFATPCSKKYLFLF